MESRVRDFFILLKPRVMSLVIFTGIIGLLLAPGKIHPLMASVAIFCIALGSGAAGAINMWYERDVDAIMDRTKNRPLPQNRIHPDEALHFAIAFAIASVILMGLFVNFLSAGLLLSAILFYVFIYTIWLKKRTPQNIVIGGAAGAFPPLIGWAAVTNNVSIEPIIMFMIIFLWTPPHFWALSLYKSGDYKKANIPMLPIVKGDQSTKNQMMFYTILLFICSLLPSLVGSSGKIYLISAIILNLYFTYLNFKLYKAKDNKIAPKLFGYSILYLFIEFSFLLIDHLY